MTLQVLLRYSDDDDDDSDTHTIDIIYKYREAYLTWCVFNCDVPTTLTLNDDNWYMTIVIGDLAIDIYAVFSILIWCYSDDIYSDDGNYVLMMNFLCVCVLILMIFWWWCVMM